MAVTMPAAPWLAPGPASMSSSPKAAAQARTSPACNVRSTDAASPTAISLNVLFTMVCIAAHTVNRSGVKELLPLSATPRNAVR